MCFCRLGVLGALGGEIGFEKNFLSKVKWGHEFD
jgi:hypothetical protein